MTRYDELLASANNIARRYNEIAQLDADSLLIKDIQALVNIITVMHHDIQDIENAIKDDTTPDMIDLGKLRHWAEQLRIQRGEYERRLALDTFPVDEETLRNKFPKVAYSETNKRYYIIDAQKVNVCEMCNTPTFRHLSDNGRYGLAREFEKHNIRFAAHHLPEPFENSIICEQCVKNGKVLFTCAFCGEKRPTKEIYSSTWENVCTTCANTLSHVEFQEKMNELREEYTWSGD